MADDKPTDAAAGDVARWHKQSGLPDDATDQGLTVHVEPGQKLQSEKMVLRATAQRLAHNDPSFEVRTLARLAASYILAGDVETARRYLDQAERMVEERAAGEARS
jgi:hypothetical protein